MIFIYILIFIVFCVLAVLGLVVLSQQKANSKVLDFMDNALDSMNKLAQIGMIHAGSKSASEAVNLVAQHQNQQLDLERAEQNIEQELKPKRLVGFTHNGKSYKFTSPPTVEMLAKIPEAARVYED